MGPPVGSIVLPGDVITDIKTFKGVTILGPGLKRHEDINSVIATKAGKLCHKPNNLYWIESQHKRYVPKKGDFVVGIVVKKAGDIYKIDIGAAEQASLSAFAFEGATKKQKPDLQLGDAVYAKLITAHREMEPELVCIDKYYKAADLGPLSNDGFVFTLPMNLIYRLLNVENPLLRTLGKRYKYDIAVGLNGKVWLNSVENKDILNIMSALFAAQYQTDKDLMELCRKC